MVPPVSNTPPSGRKRPIVNIRNENEYAGPLHVPVDQDSGPASLLTPEPKVKRRTRRSFGDEARGADARGNEGRVAPREGGEGDPRDEDEDESNSVFTPGTDTARLLLHLRRKQVVGGVGSLTSNGKYARPSFESPCGAAPVSDSPAAAAVTDDGDTPTGSGRYASADSDSPSPIMTPLSALERAKPMIETMDLTPRRPVAGGRARGAVGTRMSTSACEGVSSRRTGGGGSKSTEQTGGTAARAQVGPYASPRSAPHHARTNFASESGCTGRVKAEGGPKPRILGRGGGGCFLRVVDTNADTSIRASNKTKAGASVGGGQDPMKVTTRTNVLTATRQPVKHYPRGTPSVGDVGGAYGGVSGMRVRSPCLAGAGPVAASPHAAPLCFTGMH